MADRDPGQDSLFREIDEDLRQERFNKLWAKYGNFAIGLAVLAIVAVAGHQYWQSRDHAKRAEESAQFTSALRATMENRGAEATQSLTRLAETGTAGYALIAKFDLAAIKSRDGNKTDAAAAYLAIANNKDAAPELRDLALLLSVLQEIDNGDPKLLTDRMAPLVASANPWRFSAKEFTAYLAQRMGDSQRAGQLFRELADDATAPQGIRARAAEMSQVLGS